MTQTATQRNPLTWVPTLYFAEGLPFAVVAVMSGMMYKKLGLSNDVITFWTTQLGYAWLLKPLWSPLLESVHSKKRIVALAQIVGGALLLACALCLHLPGFFVFSMGLLCCAAFVSATHDIAADGSYIAALSDEQRARYSGWMGAFWNGGKLFVLGGMVTLAGNLESSLGVVGGWTVAMAIPGLLLIGLGFYHLWSMPEPTMHRQAEATRISFRATVRTTLEVLRTFFSQPGILSVIVFILLFRAGEGQIQTVGRLFLMDGREVGGLGLNTSQIGLAYGTAGTVAFIVGSILGGHFVEWLSLRRAMFIMILAMNVPNLTFLYLNIAQPTNVDHVTLVLAIEMFGYGFGFPALPLYIMRQVAGHGYPTAHYAIGTAVMQGGLILFGTVSGFIQQKLGYHDFFIWCVLSAIPVLILSLVLKMPEASTRSAVTGEPAL